MSAATSITNVRVFDGERLGEPITVMIDDGVIVASTPEDGGSSGDVVDGCGGPLLPG